MERSHARELVLAHPDAAPRIHTVGGFAAALGHLEPSPERGDDPRSIIDRVAAGRVRSDLLGTGPDEIDDPHGRHRRFNRDTADRLERLGVVILEGLHPV